MAIQMTKEAPAKKARSKPAAAAPAPTVVASAKQNKVPITIRLDPDVLAACRALGAGWQPQVNDILRKVFKL
jgi:uncharacterized protein (DUF4415 family)